MGEFANTKIEIKNPRGVAPIKPVIVPALLPE